MADDEHALRQWRKPLSIEEVAQMADTPEVRERKGRPDQFVPGGILATDHWHIGRNDGTCSRCRKPVPDDDVPLRLWKRGGHDMLTYCEAYLGIKKRAVGVADA